MANKPNAKSASTGSADATDPVKDSAQQIWQAGLGAFARAQAEGSKAFEALVQEGVSIQRKTQAAAEERIAEATARMASMASEISNRASGQLGKLETIFEDRVARALGKLGVPSASEIHALTERVDALNKTVERLSAQLAAGSPQPKPARKVARRAKPGAPS